jgi:hypothetical protein
MSGQTDAAAARLVDEWLAANPALAPDLRRKVLQYADELHRTARIRSAWSGAVE